MTPFFRRLSSAAQGLLVSALVIAIAVMSGYIAARAFIPKDVEAQTYVRPSRGKPIALGALTAGPFAGITSPRYDWSAFTGATIIIRRTSADDTCMIPLVTVYGHATATASASPLNALHGEHYYSATSLTVDDTYYLPIDVPYISVTVLFSDQFNILTGTDISGGTCTYEFFLIPEAFPRNPIRTSGVPYSNTVSVGTADTVVPYDAGNPQGQGPRIVTLQNHSTSVVRCGVVAARTITSGVVKSLLLAAGIGAADGTGGSLTIPDFTGSIWCTVAAGTATIGVTSY